MRGVGSTGLRGIRLDFSLYRALIASLGLGLGITTLLMLLAIQTLDR